ncbi:MAG: TolB family protein [Anaerolineales bacterium]
MRLSPRTIILALVILLLCFCLCGAVGALLYPALRVARAVVAPVAVPTLDFSLVETATPAPVTGPSGKIVFVCQIFELQAQDQLCLINADGTGWRRLTTTDEVRSYYPSFSPDGRSVVYSSNLDGEFKLHEITLGGQVTPLGDTVGYAPEVSPDDRMVVYASDSGSYEDVWLMDRDGSDRRLLYSDAWDPTWSPDGSRILFATNIDGLSQLASIKLDGTSFQQITRLPALRGRSDWSSDGAHIVTYSGLPWQRELFLMAPDGSDLRQITSGGNSQGPAFSPDGQWVAFTAYFDAMYDIHGCEIYIMRIDGTGLTRLTDNTYCDWQPRWGP